jgi:hypothetical protein
MRRLAGGELPFSPERIKWSVPGRTSAGRREEDAVKEILIKRLGNLLCIKSLVTLTLTLTAVFAFMAVTGEIGQDFMTIYAVIIAFYFGTQAQKAQGGNG